MIELQHLSLTPQLLLSGKAITLFLEKHQWGAESLGKALHRACRYGAVGVLPELVKAGANVEWKTTNGTTPLMAAAQEGHKDAAEFMLSVTANINAVRSTDGASALYLAVLGKKVCFPFSSFSELNISHI